MKSITAVIQFVFFFIYTTPGPPVSGTVLVVRTQFPAMATGVIWANRYGLDTTNQHLAHTQRGGFRVSCDVVCVACRSGCMAHTVYWFVAEFCQCACGPCHLNGRKLCLSALHFLGFSAIHPPSMKLLVEKIERNTCIHTYTHIRLQTDRDFLLVRCQQHYTVAAG